MCIRDRIYTEINNNERIIDSIEVKIRNEVINMIVLYSPRATNLRMIISYYDMTAYLERIGDLILNVSHFMKKIAVDDCLFTTYKKDLLKMLSLTAVSYTHLDVYKRQSGSRSLRMPLQMAADEFRSRW